MAFSGKCGDSAGLSGRGSVGAFKLKGTMSEVPPCVLAKSGCTFADFQGLQIILMIELATVAEGRFHNFFTSVAMVAKVHLGRVLVAVTIKGHEIKMVQFIPLTFNSSKLSVFQKASHRHKSGG